MVPTIGRIVWYYPHEDDTMSVGTSGFVGAMVQAVHGPEDNPLCVTVAGVDTDGDSFAAFSVPLFKPDEVPEVYTGVGGYATWMPYQVQQAEKNNG